MATLQTINIYYETFTVGHVLIHDTGKTSFRYDPRWLATTGSFPLSVTMPLGPGDHDDEILMPWLANLLPEEQQLMALSRALGMSSTDTLAILREIGGDTAGAISIDEANNRADWSYEPLTAHYGEQTDREALSRHFDDLGRRADSGASL